jgi:hypothetical protein
MNKQTIFSLKILRKIYSKVFRVKSLPKPECEQAPDKVSLLIYDKLMDDMPCMIARFGSTELNAIVNYLGVRQQCEYIWKYIKGEALPWWWERKRMNQMQEWSGFFPPTEEKIARFCELMLEDMKYVDVLGSWLVNEHYVMEQMNDPYLVQREIQNPFFTNRPWTKALENKKVLVVHPFAEMIEEQYKRRTLLFKNQDILPRFELKTIKAVQSLGGEHEKFNDWFEALQWMKDEIDRQDYDICLIGCGAYGFPLAAHVKRMGKKSVHLGGSLQLLFGIKGKRWADPNYNKKYNYTSLMNEYWVWPGNALKPKKALNVENGCYW